MDPGRARIRHDDAGGAEDRQAADDAEPAVERFCRQRFAAGNRNLDLGVGGAAGRGGDFGDGVADHAPRHRIDGGLARRHRQAGPRHRADAFAGAKRHAGARRAGAHRRDDQRAVGHVGIVAGVLDHAGRRRAFVPCASKRARSSAARRAAASLRPDREIRRSPAPHKPPSPPRRRRCRWSSPGAMGVVVSMLHPLVRPGSDRHHGSGGMTPGTHWRRGARACRSSCPAMSGSRAPGRAIPACSRSMRSPACNRPMWSFTMRWSINASWRLPGRSAARICRQARRQAVREPGRHQSAAGCARARRPSRAAAQGRRSLRVRARRRRSDGARGRGIPFRVIPGVTAGLAALAAASIPATLRGVNRAVIFAAGHGADEDFDWAPLARAGQPIVLYMVMHNLDRIAAALLAAGLPPPTPAAIIASAATPKQRVLISTLENFPATRSNKNSSRPRSS